MVLEILLVIRCMVTSEDQLNVNGLLGGTDFILWIVKISLAHFNGSHSVKIYHSSVLTTHRRMGGAGGLQKKDCKERPGLTKKPSKMVASYNVQHDIVIAYSLFQLSWPRFANGS